MKLKLIRDDHIVNCPYCKGEGNKVRAIWHLTGANKQACNRHKPMLVTLKEASELDAQQGYSEADDQTWRRL